MDKKQLKLTAAFVIYESKLSKQAKLQLMKFIKNEASVVQLKAFLLDGEIIPKTDSITEEIINDRFEASDKKIIKEGGAVIAVGAIAAGISVTAILAIAVQVSATLYKRFLTSAGRKCGKYTGNEQVKCMDTVKKQALEKKISVYQQYKNQCGKSKDPQKCKQKFDEKIEKTKKKIDKII